MVNALIKSLVGGLLTLTLSMGVSFASSSSGQDQFGGIKVSVEGSGQDLVFIPGLNSGPATFEETCTAFKSKYRCHLLHLPGFAGNAPLPVQEQDFLRSMRDSVIGYIRQEQLDKPVLVGHSLGGILSLMISIKEPALLKAQIIIDSLPFYSAIQNPVATAESMRPVAERMGVAMMQQSEADYLANSKGFLQGMSNQPERMATLVEWTKRSDRATTVSAMKAMMTTDLRQSLGGVDTPTLVLGAWAAYKAYGSTKTSTYDVFKAQYQQLRGVDIRLSDTAFHFISWDDPQWLQTQIQEFLSQY